MVTEIRKRDGRIVPFEQNKITNAIMNAAIKVGGSDRKTAENISNKAIKALETMDISVPDVELVQDIVEKTLIEEGHAKTAKEYILYRANRNRIREMNSNLMRTYENLTFGNSSSIDTIKKENANIDGDSSMGTMLRYGSEGAKKFNLLFLVSDDIARAHKNGDIHIHDLDFMALTETCCQIDLDKLFTNGFNTGHGFLREPGEIRSYAALACIAIQSNQNDQHSIVWLFGIRSQTRINLVKDVNILDFRIGDIIEDMEVVGERAVSATTSGRKFMSTRVVCKCIICGREKNIPTINTGS